jgi:uncharacterized protein (DUF1810 family)
LKLSLKINPSVQGLERFVEAQDQVYDSVCDELALGEKTTHWMWFIFPQLKALGRSPTAKYFGIESRQEAAAYFQHSVLGKRLVECTKLLLKQSNADAFEVFGSPDNLKFKSCMTLFREVAPEEPVFGLALERFYQGKPDDATLALLSV